MSSHHRSPRDSRRLTQNRAEMQPVELLEILQNMDTTLDARISAIRDLAERERELRDSVEFMRVRRLQKLTDFRSTGNNSKNQQQNINQKRSGSAGKSTTATTTNGSDVNEKEQHHKNKQRSAVRDADVMSNDSADDGEDVEGARAFFAVKHELSTLFRRLRTVITRNTRAASERRSIMSASSFASTQDLLLSFQQNSRFANHHMIGGPGGGKIGNQEMTLSAFEALQVVEEEKVKRTGLVEELSRILESARQDQVDAVRHRYLPTRSDQEIEEIKLRMAEKRKHRAFLEKQHQQNDELLLKRRNDELIMMRQQQQQHLLMPQIRGGGGSGRNTPIGSGGPGSTISGILKNPSSSSNQQQTTSTPNGNNIPSNQQQQQSLLLSPPNSSGIKKTLSFSDEPTTSVVAPPQLLVTTTTSNKNGNNNNPFAGFDMTTHTSVSNAIVPLSSSSSPISLINNNNNSNNKTPTPEQLPVITVSHVDDLTPTPSTKIPSNNKKSSQEDNLSVPTRVGSSHALSKLRNNDHDISVQAATTANAKIVPLVGLLSTNSGGTVNDNDDNSINSPPPPSSSQQNKSGNNNDKTNASTTSTALPSPSRSMLNFPNVVAVSNENVNTNNNNNNNNQQATIATSGSSSSASSPARSLTTPPQPTAESSSSHTNSRVQSPQPVASNNNNNSNRVSLLTPSNSNSQFINHLPSGSSSSSNLLSVPLPNSSLSSFQQQSAKNNNTLSPKKSSQNNNNKNNVHHKNGEIAQSMFVTASSFAVMNQHFQPTNDGIVLLTPSTTTATKDNKNLPSSSSSSLPMNGRDGAGKVLHSIHQRSLQNNHQQTVKKSSSSEHNQKQPLTTLMRKSSDKALTSKTNRIASTILNFNSNESQNNNNNSSFENMMNRIMQTGHQSNINNYNNSTTNQHQHPFSNFSSTSSSFAVNPMMNNNNSNAANTNNQNKNHQQKVSSPPYSYFLHPNRICMCPSCIDQWIAMLQTFVTTKKNRDKDENKIKHLKYQQFLVRKDREEMKTTRTVAMDSIYSAIRGELKKKRELEKRKAISFLKVQTLKAMKALDDALDAVEATARFECFAQFSVLARGGSAENSSSTSSSSDDNDDDDDGKKKKKSSPSKENRDHDELRITSNTSVDEFFKITQKLQEKLDKEQEEEVDMIGGRCSCVLKAVDIKEYLLRRSAIRKSVNDGRQVWQKWLLQLAKILEARLLLSHNSL